MRVRPVLHALRRGRRPVRFGSFARTEPVSRRWGYDRGTPVDRWYIDRFLERHAGDIRGRVLEVKDRTYTERFGADVTESAVVDVDPANDLATHVTDLAHGDGLPEAAFDCFVMTQTLQFIYGFREALGQARRVLAPGGVLLITVPVTSRVCEPPLTDFWRFTPLALERALAQAFPGGEPGVSGHGNVLSQVAFLEGLAAEELDARDLERDDGDFPLIVCGRVVRAD